MEQMQKEGKNLGPDAHSFEHAIVCWLRSGVPDAAMKVVELLDKMEEIESGLEQQVQEFSLFQLMELKF